MKIAVRAAQAVALLLLLLILCALGYEQIGAWRDSSRLKQVGRLVDIGGRRLNIFCSGSGSGSPTVILETGRDAPGYEWTPVQRGVSAFTQACWYDRAGLGWSDPGPDPSWGDSAASDLHRLLVSAGIKPPYVLVGHSFGGYIIRFFNTAHPREVAGMVFVDAAMEDAGTIKGIPHKDRPHVSRTTLKWLSVILGNLGMMRYITPTPGPPPKAWTQTEWNVLAALHRQRKVLVADAQEGPESATADLVRSTGGLEDMPLIVLTQGRPIQDTTSVAASVRRGWVGLQYEFAHRSRRGRQVLVPESGHGIPLEAPDAVIQAVREMVDTVRVASPHP